MSTQNRAHAKPTSARTYIVSLCVTLFVVAIAIAGVNILTHRTPANPNAVSAVPQPQTASQIAASENCVKFTDLFKPGGDASVLDAGSCYVGGKKYAIDTFASPTSRDAWLKLAEPFGVVPKWETATSVTYPSVSNS